ncbi:MAG: thiol-disulfide isomerase and thioredoxin [Moraxellaceae bacterium]|jgi:thiol-disulfide isomerase/thioredoxin|nr:thiol-disulfide isomerase and thioredoxin [Moraxellaceae bacterium]
MSLSLRRLLLPLLLLPFAAPAQAADAAPSLDLAAYRGKVVYIDFWASWCGPCRQSFPWMKQMDARHGRDGLVILAVNVDQEKAKADSFLADFSPAFPVIFDSKGALAAQFKVQTMPSSYLLDRQGKPRFKHQGFHAARRADYEKEIQQLLHEQP